MAYKFETCETCTCRYSCAKSGECSHNPAAVHCRDCGSFLINEGVEGMVCRSEHCTAVRDEEGAS